MKRQMEKTAWAMAGSAVTLGIMLTYGVATGQQAEGPGDGRGGRGGRGGMVRGTVVSKDVQNNAVYVRSQSGEEMWVQIPQGVSISKQVAAKVTELKEKEQISISGVPTAIVAESIDVSAPEPATGAAATGAAATGAAAPDGPGRTGGFGNASGFARVTGTVVALPDAAAQPAKLLTIETPEKARVAVVTNDKTRIMRRVQVSVNDVAVNEQFTAFGQPEQRGGLTILVARAAMLGEMSGGFGGRGRRGDR